LRGDSCVSSTVTGTAVITGCAGSGYVAHSYANEASRGYTGGIDEGF
jgi:hypothetical protein